MTYSSLPAWLQELLPITLLLIVIGFVLARLPKVELGHSPAYVRRRVLNWLPLGLTYAFLYMARYNLTVAKDAYGTRMDNDDFGLIFGAGTFVYGFSFIINGPLTDKIGGKRAILIGAIGSAVANLIMGILTIADYQGELLYPFSALYALNMYFQSFGAVAIVKVNAPWFHVRERGVFGAIFGILISLGIYFAFDWGKFVLNTFGLAEVYLVPAALLVIFAGIVVAMVQDSPGQAGHPDFDTADATANDDGPQKTAVEVFLLMFRNPIIMTIAMIEFCSGFLRQAIMQWYRTFAKQTGATDSFVYENWGMMLCIAGITGGVVAGVISDRLFQSRRGPVSGFLYGVLLLGAVALTFGYTSPALGVMVLIMSMAVIGVHGMLSGTASMDFGGRKNTGVAVGLIDGFVYAGTGVMSVTYAVILPTGEAAKVAANWWAWPVAMIPMAALGLILSRRVWHATPKKGGGGH